MSDLTLGLMLPSSTIFPIAKQYEKGIKDALKKANADIEIVKEFVGAGSVKQLETACDKFFSYDDVDVVAGYCSTKSVASVAEKFKTRGKSFIVSDLGGHLPNVAALNEYICLNSFHLWKHAQVLGHFGVNTFGKKGMFIGGMYDAGYSFSQMFHRGMMDADPTSSWSFCVPPMPPAGELSDMNVIFPFLEQYEPDFIFAAFCGTEASLFLNEFIKRGWNHRTKVLGLPYLITPFAPLLEDISVYVTSLEVAGELIAPETAFYFLGSIVGREIVKTMELATGIEESYDNDSGLLQAESVPIQHVSIIRGSTDYKSESFLNYPIGKLGNDELSSLSSLQGASWFNPYLCI